MTDLSSTMLHEGFVRVRGALDPAFCESIVAETLVAAGIDERDPTAWPRGAVHLPVTRNWSLASVSPAAHDVLDHLVGPVERVAFAGIQDNLILNLPDPAATPFAPSDRSTGGGWHKDGDWFRHFLDSSEQALLVIVFWRDVEEDQGPTHVAVDSIGPMARRLVEHPEGLDPVDLKPIVAEVIGGCSDFRALTGRQGDLVFAHPFLLHRASVNTTLVPRVISNTSVMLEEPMRFDRPAGEHSALERSILDAVGVERLSFRATGDRGKVVSERKRRWEGSAAPQREA